MFVPDPDEPETVQNLSAGGQFGPDDETQPFGYATRVVSDTTTVPDS